MFADRQAVAACRDRACALACRCEAARFLPSVLTSLYTSYASHDEDDPRAAFIHGYLGFLLAKLLVLCPDTAGPLILPAIPGDTPGTKLEGLLAVLGELQGVNAIFRRKLSNLAQDESMEESLTAVDAASAAHDDTMLQEAIEDLRGLVSGPPW